MVQLKSLKIMVNEESIAEAIGVPAQGERWFKRVPRIKMKKQPYR